jgi:hypothetical protein
VFYHEDLVPKLLPLLNKRGSLSTKIDVLKGSVESNYGSEAKHVSYHAIWRAKQKAVLKIYGDSSFSMLPQMVARFKEADPDNMASLRLDENHRYEGVFFALGGSRRLFNCRNDQGGKREEDGDQLEPAPREDGAAAEPARGPQAEDAESDMRNLSFFDACYVTGEQGCLMIMSTQDGGLKNVILAFAHCQAEDLPSWKWFLECAVQAFPRIASSDAVIFSDQQKGLTSALRSVLPDACKCACMYHRKNNLKATPGLKNKKDLLKKFTNCSVASTKEACDKIIEGLATEEREFFLRVPKEEWTHAYCRLKRWGLTGSQTAESVNSHCNLVISATYL